MTVALTVFQGRAGDHNDLAIPGARLVASALEARFGKQAQVIGTPSPALAQDWRVELPPALPALQAMQDRLDAIHAAGGRSVAATSRCAVSLATIPAVARHRPDLCVVWLDSNADLNTPEGTPTGYLGGLALAGPAGLWESGLGAGLALSSIVLVRARDLDPFETDLIRDHFIPLIHARDLSGLAAAVAGRPVYIHFDCDVMDPGIVPTDYSVPGGMTLADLEKVALILVQTEILGIEIAEFQRAFSPEGPDVSPASLIRALEPIWLALEADPQTRV